MPIGSCKHYRFTVPTWLEKSARLAAWFVEPPPPLSLSSPICHRPTAHRSPSLVSILSLSPQAMAQEAAEAVVDKLRTKRTLLLLRLRLWLRLTSRGQG